LVNPLWAAAGAEGLLLLAEVLDELVHRLPRLGAHRFVSLSRAPGQAGRTMTLWALSPTLISYVTGPVIGPLPSDLPSALAAFGSLPTFLGPSARLAKNLGATWGNIAAVSTSSSLPSQPGKAIAWSRSASHSGLRWSAGRSVIGGFLACFSAAATTSG